MAAQQQAAAMASAPQLVPAVSFSQHKHAQLISQLQESLHQPLQQQDQPSEEEQEAQEPSKGHAAAVAPAQ